jgi:hypothetical protein
MYLFFSLNLKAFTGLFKYLTAKITFSIKNITEFFHKKCGINFNSEGSHGKPAALIALPQESSLSLEYNTKHIAKMFVLHKLGTWLRLG